MVSLICMVGHDYQRILDGVNHWRSKEPIEAIYLIYDKKRDKYGAASQRNVRDLVDELAFAGQKPAQLGVNPQSYEEVFSTVYSILRREVDEQGRKVLIDATSTTKEAYGAIVTVSLMFQGVSVYVVPPAPDQRGWYVPEPKAPGFEEWFNMVRSVRGQPPQEIYLPGSRLERPSQEEERVLMILEERGGRVDSIKTLIEWCGENPTVPAVKNRFSRLVDKLASKGLIAEELSGKTKPLKLTGFGLVMARALKHYHKVPLAAVQAAV